MKILEIIIAGLSLIIIFYGCDSGPLTTGAVGWVPLIKNISMYNDNDPTNPVETTTFETGDFASFKMNAEDDDLNMKNLWVTEYLVNNETTAFISGPTAVPLPGQNGQQTVSWSNIDPITISLPQGNYRLDFQIEDAVGNKSNVFSLSYLVQ
jgi:hypothetical protein